jgi:hypothetical protein
VRTRLEPQGSHTFVVVLGQENIFQIGLVPRLRQAADLVVDSLDTILVNDPFRCPRAVDTGRLEPVGNTVFGVIAEAAKKREAGPPFTERFPVWRAQRFAR